MDALYFFDFGLIFPPATYMYGGRGRIILNWILENQEGVVWTVFIWYGGGNL
jgi:hypothetical protein